MHVISIRTVLIAAVAMLLIATDGWAEPLSAVELRNRLNIAQGHVRRGDYSMAARVYRELMDEHLTEDRVVRGYAGALRALGRLDEALTAFNRGDELRDPPRFVRERVSILRQLQRPDEALELCFEGLVKSPGLEQLLRNDVLQLAEIEGLDDRARAWLQERFDEVPSTGVGETLVELYLEAGKYDAAVETVNALDADESRGGFRLYDIARRLGTFDEEERALEVLKDLEKRYPESPQLREAILYRAKLHERLEDPEGAYAILSEYASGVETVDQRSFDVHMERARLLAGPLGSVEEALDVYDELLGNHLLRPRHEAIRLQRAEVQLNLARYEGALADFRELAGGSRSASVRERAEYLIGEIFFYDGELDSAAAVWARQVETFPKGELANDALKRIYLFNENYGEDGTPLKRLGQVYRLTAEGRLDVATARLDSLLAEYAEDPIEDDMLIEAGELWLQLGDPGKALPYYSDVARKYPESRLAPVAMMKKGELLESSLANPTEALTVYEELIVRYPLSIEASEVRPRVTRLRKEVRS
jgi:tetratricopeptide (TPR) repeat protein